LANAEFRFVQFDFAGRLGLPLGRWVVRPNAEAEPSHVLVVSEDLPDAKRRDKRISGQPPVPDAGSTRITVIDVTGADGTDRDARRRRAIAVVERAMNLQATAAADPFAQLSPPPPVAVRVGTGSGEDLAHGRWSDAFELPAKPSQPKRRRPAPSEGRFAELLGGRGEPLACALPTLRARADLDAGRLREAALMLDAAFSCAREELAGVITEERFETLVAHSTAVASVAAEARSSQLEADSIAAVQSGLERLEAALRSIS